MFDFNDFVYDCLTAKNAFTLQKLQNSAFRSILRRDKRTSVEQMHNEVGMPYLSVRRLKHTAAEMYKVFHNLAPDIITQCFEMVEDVSSIATRASTGGDFYLHHTRLQQTKHSFCCRGVMVWNAIPVEARYATNMEEFKDWLEIIF